MEGCEGLWGYECPGSNPWSVYAQTYYEYDELGNLTQVTDEADNETGMGYDMLGRKTWMNDPDMGSCIYTYDAVDNLRPRKMPRTRPSPSTTTS